MCQLPLFAYLPNRGVTDALLAIFDFCASLRRRCQEHSPGPWKPARTSTMDHCGGLSLDLQQAFDRLPRPQLALGLEHTGCPETLTTVLMQWLDRAHYEIAHRGCRSQLLTTRGVRQGCKAPPLEWNAFVVYLLQRLEADIVAQYPTTEPGWLIRHLLIYADDLLGRWSIETVADLDAALHQIGLLLKMIFHSVLTRRLFC